MGFDFELLSSSFVCLKNVIFVSECLEDMCPGKNGSNMYLGDDGAKEFVVVCDYLHFSHKNKWTEDGFLCP